MIVYRLCGACGLVLSGIWVYLVRENYQKRKSNQLQGYIRLFSYIKNQIECYMLPINKILFDCEDKLLSDCGYYAKKKPTSLEEVLELSEWYFEADVCEKIFGFARDFGKSYLGEQIKLCDSFILDLKALYESLSAQRIKDKKLSLAICLSISFSLILILL